MISPDSPVLPVFADPPDHPVDEELVAWMIEQTASDGPNDDEPVAAHLLACARCCDRVEELRVVIGALSQLQRHRHLPIQTRASLAALEGRGERIQHIFGSDRAEVRCAISGDADIIVLHLPVRGAELSKLSVALCGLDGQVFISFEAEHAEGGEVMLACHRQIADHNPALRVKVSRENDGEIVCDAVFLHASP